MKIEIPFAGMTGGFTLVGDSGQAAALSHKVGCHFKINFCQGSLFFVISIYPY